MLPPSLGVSSLTWAALRGGPFSIELTSALGRGGSALVERRLSANARLGQKLGFNAAAGQRKCHRRAAASAAAGDRNHLHRSIQVAQRICAERSEAVRHDVVP